MPALPARTRPGRRRVSCQNRSGRTNDPRGLLGRRPVPGTGQTSGRPAAARPGHRPPRVPRGRQATLPAILGPHWAGNGPAVEKGSRWSIWRHYCALWRGAASENRRAARAAGTRGVSMGRLDTAHRAGGCTVAGSWPPAVLRGDVGARAVRAAGPFVVPAAARPSVPAPEPPEEAEDRRPAAVERARHPQPREGGRGRRTRSSGRRGSRPEEAIRALDAERRTLVTLATSAWTHMGIGGATRLGYHDHYVVDGARPHHPGGVVTPADVMENVPLARPAVAGPLPAQAPADHVAATPPTARPRTSSPSRTRDPRLRAVPDFAPARSFYGKGGLRRRRPKPTCIAVRAADLAVSRTHWHARGAVLPGPAPPARPARSAWLYRQREWAQVKRSFDEAYLDRVRGFTRRNLRQGDALSGRFGRAALAEAKDWHGCADSGGGGWTT